MANSIGRVPSYELKTTAFPDCALKCRFAEVLGVGECEAVCPLKFDNTGNPVDGEKLKQNVDMLPLDPFPKELEEGRECCFCLETVSAKDVKIHDSRDGSKLVLCPKCWELIMCAWERLQ